MTEEDLVDTLRQCRDSASLFLKEHNYDERARFAIIPNEIVGKFASAISQVHDIAALQGWRFAIPGRGTIFDLNSVARHLIDRSVDFDPNLVVRSLLSTIQNRLVDLVEVRLIEGISIDRSLQLSDELWIVPSEDLEPHAAIVQLLSVANVPPHGLGSSPRAAIVMRRKQQVRVSVEPIDYGHDDFEQSIADLAYWNAALQTLILVSDGAPRYRQGYCFVDDIGWIDMRCWGYSSSETFPKPVPRIKNFSRDNASVIYGRLIQNRSEAIDLSLRRLESARRSQELESRVIDLGICIEVLLMSGSKDNAEISYKLATRAAWFLENEPAARVAIYRSVQELYKLRSLAVHTAKLSKLNGEEGFAELLRKLPQFDEICARILMKALELGVPSDEKWRSIVLGVPQG